MKKKNLVKSIGIIIAIIIVCAIWVVYKAFLLNTFNTYIPTEEFGNTLNAIEEQSIKTDKNIANAKFYNLNFKIQENLTEKDQSDWSKTYLNENGTIVLWILKDNLYEKSAAISEDDNTKKFGFNYEKLVKKYDINNEYDFLEYIKNNVDKKPNIFWSKSHIQMNYIANNWISTVFISNSTADKITKLKGDITGVKGDGNSMIQIHLINDDETYFIRLNKSIYPTEKISELLSSLYFD